MRYNIKPVEITSTGLVEHVVRECRKFEPFYVDPNISNKDRGKRFVLVEDLFKADRDNYLHLIGNFECKNINGENCYNCSNKPEEINSLYTLL